MPRRPRQSKSDVVYHALNRGNLRLRIFHKPGDYAAFLKILAEAQQRTRMRILGYCLMPNHFHLVLWPREDGDLSRFMQWAQTTHVRRWREHRRNVGEGHLYQGRFKSFPVQRDEHLRTLLRYVESNPLRGGLVKDAALWPSSSLQRRVIAAMEDGASRKTTPEDASSPRKAGAIGAAGSDPAGVSPADAIPQLTPPPAPLPPDWVAHVNANLTPAQLEAIRRSIARGRPFGDDAWSRRTAAALGLESTLRDPWRPRKSRPEPANKVGNTKKGDIPA